MKYAFYTLGCKVNQYETQAMQQMLLERGDTLGEFDGICDCYIVNTCTVTAVSDKKSRNAIRRARKLNPNAVIGVCGCYAQTAPGEIRKLDVDVLIGTDGRAEFLDHMAQAAREKLRWERVEDAGLPRTFEQLPADACDFEGRGWVQQFLHLLHHPLCPRAGALAANGGGSGAGADARTRGIPRDGRKRY